MTEFSTIIRPLLSGEDAPVALLGDKGIVRAPEADSILLSEFLEDDSRIQRLIDQYDAKIMAPQLSVAANLWFKAFVRSVIAPWLSHALLDNPVPRSPNQLWLDGNTFHGLYWHAQDASHLTHDEIIHTLNELTTALTAPFIPLIGQFDAWGSAGLGVADPWMSAAKKGKNQLDTDALLMNFAHFQRQLRLELQSAMQAIPIEKANTTIIHFCRRKSCCHKYELPHKSNCATCSKIPLDTQIQAILQK